MAYLLHIDCLQEYISPILQFLYLLGCQILKDEFFKLIRDKVVGGMIARLTSTSDNISSKTLSGFKADLKDKKDSISNKTLYGFVADVSSVTSSGISKITTAVRNALKNIKLAKGGVYTNGQWRPITAYAGGGNPTTGQVFIAREAGAELVGNLNGHTAVMNNDQIVQSVAQGVYKAVVSAMSKSGGNSTVVVLEGDAKDLFRVIQRQATDYTNATGLSPFPI